MGKSIFDFVAPIAGGLVGGPIGAAVGSGLSTGIRTGNPISGLLSAGGSYLGGAIGGDALGGIGSQTIGKSLGSTAGNILGPSIANTSLGSIAGSTFGSSLGETAGQSLLPQAGSKGTPENPFNPSQQGAMDVPPSLSQFASLSPEQQTSNIATQGVYGGGQGPEESKYFLNLINRRLVDPSGKVGDIGQINPVENSFLAQLGLGGYGNSRDLLKGISQYR